MIIDNLNNSDIYRLLHPRFAKVFDYIKTLKATDGAARFVLDEGNIWGAVSVKDEVLQEERRFEAHKNFVDLHFVLQGAESFCFADTERLTPATEYNEEKDVYMLTGSGDTVVLHAGQFCITYPQDAHIPTLTKECDESLVRGVVKIRI